MIYDAFAHLPLYGLGDLGFMPHEETGKFIADGNTRPGGKLPLNTNGGGLSYMHSGMYGMYALQESVRQMRGIAPAQVPGAKISVCHGVGGMFAASGHDHFYEREVIRLRHSGMSAQRQARNSRRSPGSSSRSPRNDEQQNRETTMAKSLQDKVIIVTGAGRGIGREIALLCAAEGAKVVVNDPGGAADGAGSSASPAEEVVEEIKKRGGTAVANFEIGGGSDPRQQDREDRNRSFRPARRRRQQCRHPARHDLPQDERGSVRVRHQGAPDGLVLCRHAAARLFREQESGSFVHFTSTSGLVGNYGQANYAAAKLGIVGLSKSIALDMGRFNVRSNCVSPFAWTRMIGTIPTETEAEKARVEKIQQMGPEKIAPVCAYLLSDAAKDVTGQIFGVRMNEIFLIGQIASGALGSPRRRLDAADHRRTRQCRR